MELFKNYKQGKVTEADVRKINNTVIWLMVLIALTSIIWSISLHILSADFNNGIIGAKLVFQERDFEEMDNRSKEIFYEDLGQLINETYTEAALKAKSIETTDDESPIEVELKSAENETTTAKPKKKKIAHLFQTSSSLNHVKEVSPNDDEDDEDDEADEANTTVIQKSPLDVIADRRFLASMTADIDEALWRQSAAVQFIYSFPFLTEMIAIIWTAMCLVFQAGVKKYWGLPKPWRIVVPSIFIFTLMTFSTLIYAFFANHYLKHFCANLKAPLSDPSVISCGQAISVLRPIIKHHQFKHDFYLSLFNFSYVCSFLLWAAALVIMVLRYIFAVDFQLVDIRLGYESPPQICRSSEFTAVATSQVKSQQSASQMLQIDERKRPRSEDDFQSAKSHLSEMATPLLEQTATQVKIV